MATARWYLALAAFVLLAACGDGGEPPGLIAFTLDGAAYTVAPDGSGSLRLVLEGSSSTTPEPYRRGIIAAALSPDGSQLAFVRDYNIWAAGVDGGDQRLVADVASFDIPPPDMPRASRWSVGAVMLAWSRDGGQIAYLLSRLEGSGIQDIGVVAAEGGEPRTIYEGGGAFVGSLAWTGDGRIAFVECDNVVKLLSPADGSIDKVTLPIDPECTGRTAQPQPDGHDWLVGTRGRRDGTDGGPGTPVEDPVLRVRDGAVEEVAVGVQPVWSPDGAYIAFLHEGVLRVARADGSEARDVALVFPPEEEVAPTVSGFSLSWGSAE